ncbi:MAG: hypothetical protein JW955_08910 [Sedimentisphaerales bacterium]|nr:hypothetical protein [Sedimentisphaerales bacterium]
MDTELSVTRSFGRRVLPALVALLIGPVVTQGTEYYSSKALSEHLAWLAGQDPNLIRVRDLAESRDKRKVWLVDIGIGTEEDRNTRPAMLVVAGIEGNDLVGPFTAVAWIEDLLKQYREEPAKAQFLKTTTIYVVPCLNPDATKQFFAEPRVESSANDAPCDDDHDGLTDEDGGEDLNGDGLITMMRVEDKEGHYSLDPNDNRLLLKADPAKGETPAWKLLPEGVDSDHDRKWNEDGPGGTNFNRNFPYGYKHFAVDAGIHPVCENETRALADFVVAHPNIGIVLTYGAADNLRKTPKAAASPGRGKPMEAVDEKDIGYYEALGKIYRARLGLDKELECTSEPGTFSDWMYFHRGRLSLAARPWDVAMAVAQSKARKAKDKKAKDAKAGEPNDPNSTKADPKADKKEGDKRNKDEREQLKWLDEHAPDAFVAWQAVEHPDFPGQRVEVGGYRPFARTNPPAAMLPEIAAKHGDFLTELVQRLPRIQVARIECRLLADSLFEIEILVANTGFLPTSLAHGETTREVYPTRVVLDLEPSCFLAGARTTVVPPIAGHGGTAKVRCTIRVPDRKEIRFQVISMLAGRTEGTIELLKASETGASPSRP